MKKNILHYRNSFKIPNRENRGEIDIPSTHTHDRSPYWLGLKKKVAMLS